MLKLRISIRLLLCAQNSIAMAWALLSHLSPFDWCLVRRGMWSFLRACCQHCHVLIVWWTFMSLHQLRISSLPGMHLAFCWFYFFFFWRQMDVSHWGAYSCDQFSCVEWFCYLEKRSPMVFVIIDDLSEMKPVFEYYSVIKWMCYWMNSKY